MPGRGPRYSEEGARVAVAAARSHFDAMVRLGVRPAGGKHATLKKYLALWGISTDHFDWGGARPPKRGALPLEEVLVYLAVGRKYGVSDNAIRKWVRAYERERAPGHEGAPERERPPPLAA